MAVVGSRCACCGEICFVENVEAAAERERTGEAVFCQSCMELPEKLAAFLIIINDLWQDLCHVEENVTGQGCQSPAGR
mgnify:CR=1 FL=1